MTWIKVESSVSRHRKFVKAGPAASWLWLCGLAYCQEGLTDGLIPREALPYLGIPNALKLAKTLESAGLWDVDPDGWRVHDYLVHNKPASTVKAIQDERRVAGKHGGLASGETRRAKQTPEANAKQVASTDTKQPSNPDQIVQISSALISSDTEARASTNDPPMDLWTRELVNLYPAQARCAFNYVERPLFAALTESSLPPGDAWEALKARLEQHKRSHQWRIKGMIPRLDKWLREGYHLQELPESPPVADQLSAKTNRTLHAAAEILKGGA